MCWAAMPQYPSSALNTALSAPNTACEKVKCTHTDKVACAGQVETLKMRLFPSRGFLFPPSEQRALTM